MSTEDIYGGRIKSFQKLMRFKVRDILLVASLYDQYLFEKDGRLYQLIRQEFQVLNLSHPPEITHVTSGEEAIGLLSSGENFDLVITTLHIEDMPVIRVSQKVGKRALIFRSSFWHMIIGKKRKLLRIMISLSLTASLSGREITGYSLQ